MHINGKGLVGYICSIIDGIRIIGCDRSVVNQQDFDVVILRPARIRCNDKIVVVAQGAESSRGFGRIAALTGRHRNSMYGARPVIAVGVARSKRDGITIGSVVDLIYDSGTCGCPVLYIDGKGFVERV